LTERFGQNLEDTYGKVAMYRNRGRKVVPEDLDGEKGQVEGKAPAAVAVRTAPQPGQAQLEVPPGGRNQPVGAAPEKPEAAPAERRRGLKRALVGVAALVLASAAGWYGYKWWTVGRFIVSTDDAYVGAYSTTLAAKVPGYVAGVAVEDNATVRAGDVIARIDDGDYRLAVKSAQDNVATQQATIARIGRQVTAQQAAVDQARAQLASAQAAATRAELELARQQALATREFASRQTLEQAQANRDQTAAAVQAAQAAVDVAAANVDVLKAQQSEAEGTLRQLQTAQQKAERDLSFTVIRAPFDGVIGNRAVQTGDYLQPGQRLAALIPLNDVYVDANFKETQLASLRPGQPVEISVDALPGRKIEGTVTSLAPASGSVFSLLPPDNATGNFTKIVQRVPVRVRVPGHVGEEQVLRPGMSVVVGVDTRAGAAERPVAAHDANKAAR
jgi:membrane fusion protein, multidrug efflux system